MAKASPVQSFLLSVVPAIMTLLLLLIYLVPKHISGLGSFMPLLPLAPVFYWGLHPRQMPYWFVFALGLVMDSVSGQPLGLSSLLNVFFLAMVQAQHKHLHKEGFPIKWSYFALLLGGIMSLHFLLIAMFNSAMSGFLYALIQWALTVGLYPVLHRFFDMVERHSARQRWLSEIRR